MLRVFRGWGATLSVLFLVAGTCIGGGILALPVVTAPAGFIPSLIMMAVACVFMATTGLLFVEANLWMGPGAHLITMSGHLLGPTGRFVTAALYMFIGYLSLAAYIAGGGDLLIYFIEIFSGFHLVRGVAALLFTLVIGGAFLVNRHFVGRINALLVVAMGVAYILLLSGGLSEVNGSFLFRQGWPYAFMSLPLILTIFSYQAVVPSLVIYLKGHRRHLVFAIVGGAILAFLIYAFWQCLMLGVIPLEGKGGLAEAFATGKTGIAGLRLYVNRSWIAIVGEFFALFAIVTSYLGIGLGLYDFLRDALHNWYAGWRRSRHKRLKLVLLVLLPAFAIAISNQRIFIEALDATGGFGDAILNGLIPVLMVWSGRYLKNLEGLPIVKGGRIVLSLVFLFALLVLAVEILERVSLLQPIEDLR